MKAKTEACVSFFLISFGFLASFAQAPAQPPQQPEFVKQGQQLIREGKPDEALARYRKTLQTTPDSVSAIGPFVFRLVVQAGSMVEFPNRDPFFHNVFSLFEGKRFDLGLYEAGASRMVRFDRPGISYICCNIHPEMSAVVITIATSLYAISNQEEQISLADVPYGRYVLRVWSEGMGPENEQPLTRVITIANDASSLGVIRVPAVNGQRMAHKNKYGREYDEPTPNNSVYKQEH